MPDAIRRGEGQGTPIASVVIPVYNGVDVIGDCLRSLLAQDMPRQAYEVIVVDNGSTDDTLGQVAPFAGEIRLLHEPIRGASSARNRGIHAASGRVIALTDADCVVASDWLGSLVAAANDPTVGVAGGPVLSRRPCNRIAAFGERVHDQRAAILKWKPPYVASGNWGSRRDVLLEAGLFDPALLRGQDAELSRRIHRAGYRLVYVPEARVFHRNEDSLLGLLREGYQHGRAGVAVRTRLMAAGELTHRTAVRRRARRSLRDLVAAPGSFDSWLQLLFDTAKSVGEIAAVMPGPRRDDRQGRGAGQEQSVT